MAVWQVIIWKCCFAVSVDFLLMVIYYEISV